MTILVVGAVLRIALLASTPHFVMFGDAVDYQRHGVSIAAGLGYPPTEIASPGTPSAFRPPAYPFLLGGVYAVSSDSVKVGRLLGILLGEALIALLYLAGTKIWNRRVGLTAALIGACFPPFIGLSVSLLSETLFLPVELGVCVVLGVAMRCPGRLRWWALVGGLCGLAALTRAVAEVWVLVAVVAAVSRPISPVRRLSSALVVMLAFGVALAPWTIRNIVEFHAAIPISTEGGFTLAGQYNEAAGQDDALEAVWREPFAVAGLASALSPLYTRAAGVNESQLDTALRQAGITYARRHPVHVLAAAWLDSLRMLDLGRAHRSTTNIAYWVLGTPESLRSLTTLSAQGLALLAAVVVVGALSGRLRADLRKWWLWALAIVTYLTTVPVVGNPIKLLPLDVFLVLLVAAGITFSGRVFGRRRT